MAFWDVGVGMVGFTDAAVVAFAEFGFGHFKMGFDVLVNGLGLVDEHFGLGWQGVSLGVEHAGFWQGGDRDYLWGFGAATAHWGWSVVGESS